MLATCIVYGLMIPSGPTDPSVVDKRLGYAVNLTNKFGMNHTVVTADHALCEIAFGLREQAHRGGDPYQNLIIMLVLCCLQMRREISRMWARYLP